VSSIIVLRIKDRKFLRVRGYPRTAIRDPSCHPSRHPGWRGAARGDTKAAAKAIAALSRFIADFAGELREVEITPWRCWKRAGAALHSTA
jgi:hypothetical protein